MSNCDAGRSQSAGEDLACAVEVRDAHAAKGDLVSVYLVDETCWVVAFSEVSFYKIDFHF